MNKKRIIVGLASLISWVIIVDSPGAEIHMVYPDGSGEFANIQAAIDAAIDGDTVMLADGTFAGRGNMNVRYYGKAIVLCSQSGHAEMCIIDVGGEANWIAERGVIFDNDEDSLSVLRDITVIHGSADAPCPECEGGGIYIHHSSPTVINVICRDNYALNGAGIMIVRGHPTIRGCLFSNNAAFDGGGLMGLDSARATIANCVISGNHADLRGGGVSLQARCQLSLINCTISNNDAGHGSGISAWESDFILKNTIISFNDSGSVFSNGASSFDISYSDIFGNIGGDWVDPIDSQLGIAGNICADPLFVDTSTANFHLRPNSPCIDSADPDSPDDPDGTRADMGALYYDQVPAADRDPLPENFRLGQNYPNPFNANTTIEFLLPQSGNATLEVFDIAGHKIATLLSGDHRAGLHRIVVDAAGWTSGIYLYRLQVGDAKVTRRLALVK
jgi:hypothetical protein